MKVTSPDWQTQAAKSRFSELIEAATKRGPQSVTHHGERCAVVLSAEDFERLSRRQKIDVKAMERRLKKLFPKGPLKGNSVLLDRAATT